MKNITFSADEAMLQEARRLAAAEHTTLNEKFRLWLGDYVGRRRRATRAMRTVRELGGRLRVGAKLTRDEMNER